MGIDIVENLEERVKFLGEMPSPDENPNPIFTEADIHSTMNFVPQPNITPVRIVETGSGYGRLSPIKHNSVVGEIIESYIEEVADHVTHEHYDSGVIEEMNYLEASGFCLGNIKTHTAQYSYNRRKRRHLLEIIHYAAMALHSMDRESEL